MKIYMRLLSVFLLLLIPNFSSCSTNIEELEHVFEKYKSDNNVVAVLDDSAFYFADHTLDLRDIVVDDEPNHGYLFKDCKLYFSTSKQNGMHDFSLFVYECDTYGSNKILIFEKHGYKTHPWVIGNEGILYIEYYETVAFDSSARKIDSYNVFSGVYENVAMGKEASLSDYKKDIKKDYLCNFEDGVLSILDVQKNEEYKVDNDMLRKSEFSEALTGLDILYHSCHVMENNQIYLLYRIKTNGSSYPFFICEFIPSENEVVFKSLFFAYDVESISVENIGQ